MLRREPSYGYEIVTTLNALGPLSAGENTVLYAHAQRP